MRLVGIIPARFQSSRLPGKPLVMLCGVPMIVRVCKIVAQALGKENAYVATDDQRIADVVIKHGYKVIMTHSNHATGTDRIAEAAMQIEADIYLNIQGDEPLINPQDILNVGQAKVENPTYIINGYTAITSQENPESVNLPKVVFNQKNELLYISRSLIPGSKNKSEGTTYYKQVCIYAFSKKELQTLIDHPEKTVLEKSEDIEIIRFLELGYRILVVNTSSGSLAVDVPEDIKKVEYEITSRGL